MGYGSGVAVSCGVGGRHGSDPVLLWLWGRPAAVVLTRPLSWEPPYATCSPKKSKKKKKIINVVEILALYLWYVLQESSSLSFLFMVFLAMQSFIMVKILNLLLPLDFEL